MSSAELWPWAALLLLGALHGINPGMGWLFAVALGLQQGERRAVWRALAPLAAGHALAIAAAVAAAAAIGVVVPAGGLRWVVAAALLALGVRQLRGHGHAARGGMRVGARELTTWSFLVATAHGAGLMAVPFAMDAGENLRSGHDHAMHAAHGAAVAGAAIAGPSLSQAATVGATLVHSAGYLLVTAIVAWLVYDRLGLRLLRRAWLNVDRLWAGSLVITAAVVAFT